MSGLRQRLIAYAEAVQEQHPGTAADTTAKLLRLELDRFAVVFMLRSISEVATITLLDLPWWLGAYEKTYNRLVSLVNATRDELLTLGDLSLAEFGEGLLTELGTGARLTDAVPDEAVEDVLEDIEELKKESTVSVGQVFALYLLARLAFSALERRL